MTTVPSASGTDRVTQDAAARGLEVEVVSRPAAGSLHEAAELLGIEPASIVKSLVVKKHDGTFLFALVPGGRQISWSKLRSVVAVNKLSLPSPELALEATGYERGTITPIGSSTAWPVFADERIRGRRVALGAGAHGFSAFVDGDALLAAYDAVVADITDDEVPR
ncbi:YbaK/EbsC family protein [Frondihabitans peucedani]|uniref:YbaK/EbsC family protein n=1 Tax=Frondihabitans peucedani TaxID=598626 RepID=A0ABP8DY87_9MICO